MDTFGLLLKMDYNPSQKPLRGILCGVRDLEKAPTYEQHHNE